VETSDPSSWWIRASQYAGRSRKLLGLGHDYSHMV